MFTACNVDRDGLISGAEDVSQVSRCRMNCLSIAVFVSALNAPSSRESVSMSALQSPQRFSLPLSLKYRHSTARATPAERSVPVEQVNSIRGFVTRFLSEAMKGGIRGSCVRRARLPSLPTPQERTSFSALRFSPSIDVLVSAEVSLHIMMPSNDVKSVGCFARKMLLVGRINTAELLPV